MPKANHGLVVPGDPQPLDIRRRSLSGMLKFLRPRVAFENLANELLYTQIGEKADQLEARLTELHDAVEKAIDLLNQREEVISTERENLTEDALAELNRVL